MRSALCAMVAWSTTKIDTHIGKLLLLPLRAAAIWQVQMAWPCRSAVVRPSVDDELAHSCFAIAKASPAIAAGLLSSATQNMQPSVWSVRVSRRWRESSVERNLPPCRTFGLMVGRAAACCCFGCGEECWVGAGPKRMFPLHVCVVCLCICPGACVDSIKLQPRQGIESIVFCATLMRRARGGIVREPEVIRTSNQINSQFSSAHNKALARCDNWMSVISVSVSAWCGWRINTQRRHQYT